MFNLKPFAYTLYIRDKEAITFFMAKMYVPEYPWLKKKQTCFLANICTIIISLAFFLISSPLPW